MILIKQLEYCSGSRSLSIFNPLNLKHTHTGKMNNLLKVDENMIKEKDYKQSTFVNAVNNVVVPQSARNM